MSTSTNRLPTDARLVDRRDGHVDLGASTSDRSQGLFGAGHERFECQIGVFSPRHAKSDLVGEQRQFGAVGTGEHLAAKSVHKRSLLRIGRPPHHRVRQLFQVDRDLTSASRLVSELETKLGVDSRDDVRLRLFGELPERPALPTGSRRGPAERGLLVVDVATVRRLITELAGAAILRCSASVPRCRSLRLAAVGC
jgi:hypothetical protein